jgi:hypothetical protein
MFGRIFGRKESGAHVGKPAIGHRPHPKPFPGDVTCGAGCGKVEGYRCAYRDATGRRCTYWRKDHSMYLNGRIWCQRHANSVRWLEARDGSIYEILATAAIDDRSPNLVGTLVDELNRDITPYLTSCFGGHRGVHIVTDGNIRASSIPKGGSSRRPTAPES